jgi:hypothetical protein
MKKLLLIPIILLGFTSCQKEEELIEPKKEIRTIFISGGEIYRNIDYPIQELTTITVEQGTSIYVNPDGCSFFSAPPVLSCQAVLTVVGVGDFIITKDLTTNNNWPPPTFIVP